MRFLRQNAIALLALAVALGGTAYAHGRIGGNDLKQINKRNGNWVQIAPGTTTRANVTCRRNEILLRGGFESRGGVDADGNLTRKITTAGDNDRRRTYRIFGTRDHGSQGAQMRAVAYCLRR